jgi:hypothetical protein
MRCLRQKISFLRIRSMVGNILLYRSGNTDDQHSTYYTYEAPIRARATIHSRGINAASTCLLCPLLQNQSRRHPHKDQALADRHFKQEAKTDQ